MFRCLKVCETLGDGWGAIVLLFFFRFFWPKNMNTFHIEQQTKDKSSLKAASSREKKIEKKNAVII